MPTHLVNLDALIRREDFEVETIDPHKNHALDEADKLKIVELERDSLMYRWLRKPDFQRTTAHWPPTKVAGFIESFVSGDLIPALILWQSETSGIFVIDGAHRLSALIAWVHDDYGDRAISLPFFENNIQPEQKQAAEETRKIIAERVGSYLDIKHAQTPSPERARYASNLAVGGVTLQWVHGDASRAERSFHTINTEQTPIGELELRLIRDRRCPNAIATRALVGAGTGRYAPSTFSEENKARIKTLSKQVYDNLFVPPLQTPIKTLDLPVAGCSYSADSIRLILDFVEFVNKTTFEPVDYVDYLEQQPPKGRRMKNPKKDMLLPTMQEDRDGSITITFLRNVQKMSSRIAGMKPESLGLHPAVYFYSATGKYQPAAFLAAVNLVGDFETKGELNVFTTHRNDFEDFLVKHKYLINQIVRKFGSGHRSLGIVTRLYRYIFDGVVARKTEAEILPNFAEDDRLSFLKPVIEADKGVKQDFSTERKSAVFLRKALEGAVRCMICKARIHRVSMTVDHITDKQHGGRGSDDNAQLTHPYCNSTYKEWLRSQEAS